MDEFRTRVAEFLARSVADGRTCPAYGAILPPHLHEPARAWQATMHEAGFAALHWPTAFGGRGLDRSHTTVWLEECARADVAPYLNLQGMVLAAEAILRSGTDDQKSAHLPNTATGTTLWCQLFSEPEAGSDLASLRTTAVEDGERFIVNGQKVWSSNAQFAEMAILLARTDTHVATHRGISFFLLDMSLPGIEVRPITQMTGDQEFCEVFLTDVEVPATSLLGGRETGWTVAMDVLIDERGSFGEAAIIALEREIERLATLDVESGSVVGNQLGAAISEANALRSLLGRIGANPMMAPAAKLMQTEFESATHELESTIRGSTGMLDDAASRAFLYAAGMRIAGGTSEIQRNIIGERLLGLPKEPRG